MNYKVQNKTLLINLIGPVRISKTLWVHIGRLLPVPSVILHRLDTLHVESVQHAGIQRPRVNLGCPEVPRRLGKGGNVLVGEMRVGVGTDVHAARLAKRLAPDVIAKSVIEQVVGPLDGELV